MIGCAVVITGAGACIIVGCAIAGAGIICAGAGCITKLRVSAAGAKVGTGVAVAIVTGSMYTGGATVKFAGTGSTGCAAKPGSRAGDWAGRGFFVARFFFDGPFSFLPAYNQYKPPQRARRQQRAKSKRSQPHHGQLERPDAAATVVVVVMSATVSFGTIFIWSLMLHGLVQFQPTPSLPGDVNDHKTYWKSDKGEFAFKNV
mmetsp:Transcript_61510/g.171946  ORF Transcript_61510/g.171946 Transcript_61510/m.171946 type:complete len:202 (-) Transcript_61510:276-881(-)